MSYMALYRKWRPDAFEEVKGQEHIVTTLKNQIKHDRIGHAYLFCGTRGTGKTTIAKLLSKAVNCEHPVDGSPCNECASCKAIAAGSALNVIEIDAASNNGVDNIRQINSAVQYSPQSGKYLVYIIDEVHMLSTGAFNALLKTLEEPPGYVIFILATTEVHKIPITILSRCQRYDFRRISIETIADRLADLLSRENISATKEALAYVAKAADGSMRDALSILDQCIAFNLGEELTYDRVLSTIGAVDIEVYMELFSAVKESDVCAAVEIIDNAIWQGKDFTQFVNEFTGFVRNVLMLKLSPDMTVDMTSDNAKRLIEMGADITEGYLINYINILQDAAGRISHSTTKRIVLEVAIIKLCKPAMQQGYDAMEKRVEQLEEQLLRLLEHPSVPYISSEGTAAAANTGNDDEAAQKNMGETDCGREVINNIKKSYDEATAKEILMLVDLWNEYKEQTLPTTRRYLDKIQVEPGEEKSTLKFVIVRSGKDSSLVSYFSNDDIVRHIAEDFSEMAKRDIHIRVQFVTKEEASRSGKCDLDFSKIKCKIIDI